jgi:hypothetical protein
MHRRRSIYSSALYRNRETAEKKEQPEQEIDLKMAATIICPLTINTTQNSIQSIVINSRMNEKSIRNILAKKRIKCYKKRRNLIPKTEERQR